MQRLRWVLLFAAVLLATTSVCAGADTPSADSAVDNAGTQQPAFEPPEWVLTARVVMAGVGMIVLIGALGVWAVRGRVLAQMRDNFTPWGGAEAVVLFLSWALLKSVPITLVMRAGDWKPRDVPMGWVLATDALAAGVVIGLGVWMMRRLYGVTGDSLGVRWDKPLTAVALAVGALLAVTPIQLAIGMLFETLGVKVEQGVVQDVARQSGMGMVLAAVMAVVVAPVVEELLFRGVVQMGLRRYVGPWGAIVLGGAIFAAIHYPPWPAVLLIFPLGLALGYLYQRRQSLVAPVALHMLFNALTILAVVTRSAG